MPLDRDENDRSDWSRQRDREMLHEDGSTLVHPLESDSAAAEGSASGDFQDPAEAEAAKRRRQLQTMLRAKYGAVLVLSHEERRVLRQLFRYVRRDGLEHVNQMKVWANTSGLVRWVDGGNESQDEKTQAPPAALDKVLEASPNEGTLFVFRGLQHYLESAQVLRRLRECANHLRGSSNVLVLLSPEMDLPTELSKVVTTVDYPLPTRRELGEMVKANLDDFEGPARSDSSELREAATEACVGLTMSEAEDALARSVMENEGIGPEIVESINEAKRELIRESGSLEFVRSDESFDTTGGLKRAKEWFRKRKHAFSEEARRFGIEPPKGVMMMGIPGTGKGLVAKAVAQEWQMPLLRLDMGAVFGSLVGESEANLRRALKVAEAIGSSILWLDEVEKALAGGGSSGKHDSGVTARLFGNLLTWLAEKESPTFVYFTANDISRLPPELLRKGRVDEIFFLDLPGPEARKEILRIHLRKRGRRPEDYDITRLAEASRGLVGSEIEQAIKEALVDAFSAGTALQTDHILAVIDRTVPLVETQQEKLVPLFEFVQDGRAQRASKGELLLPEVLDMQADLKMPG